MVLENSVNHIFLVEHFDTIITVIVTIVGFVVTILVTQHSFKNEITKDKIANTTKEMLPLVHELLDLMDNMIKGDDSSNYVDSYRSILSKVIAYGSKDAVKIATYMQQNIYQQSKKESNEDKYKPLVLLSLLIIQLKYDLTNVIIPPDSWFKIKINDYDSCQQIIETENNNLVKKQGLNPLP